MGVEIGREVVRLLHEHPELSPRDITFICEYHHDGVAAVAVIEAAGHPVHHLFSRDPDDARRRRRYRFWPDAEAVKGCTVHSFKGWETPALVMGIGVERRSRRLAYVAMTRLQARHDQRPSIISVAIHAEKLDGRRLQVEVRVLGGTARRARCRLTTTAGITPARIADPGQSLIRDIGLLSGTIGHPRQSVIPRIGHPA